MPVPGTLFPKWKRDIAKVYDFIEELGEGGFATVWKVKRKKDKKLFACKVLTKANLNSDDKKALIAEAQIMQALKHPNIVTFIQGFETYRRLYFVMEMCKGGDLLDLLSKYDKLKESDVKHIVHQLLLALEEAHKKGIVHCDLKPENALVTAKGSKEIKLIDFGLSRKHHRFEWLKEVGGTPMYIAPECLNERYDDSIDIWAIGIMTFEMLYGYLPFDAESGDAIETIELAAKGFQPVEKSGEGPWFKQGVTVSQEAKAFITELLNLDPSGRPTATEALANHWFSSETDHELHANIVLQFRKKNHLNKVQKFAKTLCSVKDMHNWMVEDIKKLFGEYQENGKMSCQNFSEAMHKLTADVDKITTKDITDLFEDIDEDHSGYIDVDEFLHFYAYQYCVAQDDRLWNFAKSLADKKTRRISIESVNTFLSSNPEHAYMDNKTLKDVMALLARKPMTIKEFLHAMM